MVFAAILSRISIFCTGFACSAGVLVLFAMLMAEERQVAVGWEGAVSQEVAQSKFTPVVQARFMPVVQIGLEGDFNAR